MKRIFRYLIFIAFVTGVAGWVASAPKRIDPALLSGIEADPARGEFVFNAAGCASCHMAKDASADDRLKLGGGQEFPSPFGTFVAPNISNHKTAGIGMWTSEDLANAVLGGVSPDGRHYFPAFPYGTYSRMTLSDVVSLRAYLASLPAVEAASKPHRVPFPFNIRRSVGIWKMLFLSDDWVVTGDLTEQQEHGRYLVEALGHCGECHTSRNLLGGLKLSAWLEGAPNPAGKGTIPNITPDKLTWSEADIAEYLKSGFTPKFDTAGGHMVAVIENTAKLSPDDRQAIAVYLKTALRLRE